MTFFSKPCINFSKGILCILSVHSIAVQGIDKFWIFPITLKYCIALPHRQSINVFSDWQTDIWIFCFIKGLFIRDHMLELVLWHSNRSIVSVVINILSHIAITEKFSKWKSKHLFEVCSLKFRGRVKSYLGLCWWWILFHHCINCTFEYSSRPEPSPPFKLI